MYVDFATHFSCFPNNASNSFQHIAIAMDMDITIISLETV